MAESDLSNEVNATTVLPAASGVSASLSGTDVDVTWTNNDDSSDGGIDVERSTDGFSTVTTVTSGLSTSTTSYTDTSVAAAESYQYRIERNTDHATSTSNAITVDTPYPIKVNGNYVFTLTVNGKDVTGIELNGSQVL